MKKTIITAVAALLALCSCEKQFDFHPEKYSNMIRLECVALGGADTLFIYPQLCVPAHTKRSADESLHLKSLTVSVDGAAHQPEYKEWKEYQETVRWDNETGMAYFDTVEVTRSLWYVPEHIREGSQLEVRASAEGTDDIYAQTTVPVQPKLVVKIDKKEDKEKSYSQYIKFSIPTEDIKDGYYGIQVRTQESYIIEFSPEAKEEGETDIHDVREYSQSPSDWNEDESAFEDIESGNNPTIGFDGRRLVGYDGIMRLYTAEELLQSPDVYAYANYNYDMQGDWYVLRERHESRYQLVVYKLSAELYRYAKAYNLMKRDTLAELGLSPVNFTYTNVSGGAGYFGALSVWESEWFENPLGWK